MNLRSVLFIPAPLIKTRLACLIVLVVFSCNAAFGETVWLDRLDLSNMSCGWEYYPCAGKTVEGTPLSLGGKVYSRGVGTSPTSAILMNVDRCGSRFTATVGVDDRSLAKSEARFFVLGDGRIIWQSGAMKKGDAPKNVDVSLRGIKQVGLLVTGHIGKGNLADWCDAKVKMSTPLPDSVIVPGRDYYIFTPKAPNYPMINSAKVFGVRPGDLFLFTIGASGARPMRFQARHLPDGLTLNPKTGRITGVLRKSGDYRVTLIAENKFGKAEQKFRIEAGDKICLTPPMGWNSWNAWGLSVDSRKIRAAADAIVKEGLIDYGWSYIVIDGGWTVKPNSKNPLLGGRPYNSEGMINPNRKFRHMMRLSSFIHANGLKLGLHTSPGPFTCSGLTASYGHERENAERFEKWGVDFIKYDWCTYTRELKDSSLESLEKPFLLMHRILGRIRRDIVLSINPGPIGRKRKPWTWGREVGANMCRTTGDINDTWRSVSRIGFSQHYANYAGPGYWNDPDMLVIGRLGWGMKLHPSKLTPDEQYSQMSLWCLLSAPLMLGCDLTHLDPFTLNLISNNEVIAIDQDALGKEARCVYDKDGKQIWAKGLQDGAEAVGLFYVGKRPKKPSDFFRWEGEKQEISIRFRGSMSGIRGKFKVRDVWRQKNLGTFNHGFIADVPYHGVELIEVTPVR